MQYDVDPENRRCVCSVCFGAWDPEKLNKVLKIKPKEVKDVARTV